MKAAVFSANEWLYPDTEITAGTGQIVLDAAKNSIACCQIMTEGEASFGWSEEHWEMIRQYGEIMREAHQTDFWIPMSIIGLSGPVMSEKQEIGFDFSKAKRLIKLYLSLGFTYINSFTPFVRKNWADENFFIRLGGMELPAFSPEGMQLAKAFFTQWYAFLQQNQWFDRTYQHVGDEPLDQSAKEYCALAGLIRTRLLLNELDRVNAKRG